LQKLTNTYLPFANLSQVNLSNAILTSSNLSEASLISSNFQKSKLDQTIFNNSILSNTIFANVDLSCATGLNKVKHENVSVISIETIYHSKGKIPVEFLQGCGVSDEIIGKLHQIFNFNANEHSSVSTQLTEANSQHNSIKHSLETDEIGHQNEILSTLRKRLQERIKNKARVGDDTEPHIPMEIKKIRHEIAELKAYLRAHGVEVKDFYDDVER
jgi:hypothetical protein